MTDRVTDKGKVNLVDSGKLQCGQLTGRRKEGVREAGVLPIGVQMLDFHDKWAQGIKKLVQRRAKLGPRPFKVSPSWLKLGHICS